MFFCWFPAPVVSFLLSDWIVLFLCWFPAPLVSALLSDWIVRLLLPVFPSPETIPKDRKSLIQLIQLRPSWPPLFVCPFSEFSPYIHPFIPPFLSLCVSLSLPLSTDQLLSLAPPPAAARPRPSRVPQVNCRCPGHTPSRKGPGSPYGPAEKGPFCDAEDVPAQSEQRPRTTGTRGSTGGRGSTGKYRYHR